MIPLMISQIFLFPIVAGAMMNNWTDSRRTLELKEISSHVGSAISQLYSSVNHDSISAGTVISKVDVALFIDGYAYVGNASLRTASDVTLNSSKILDITFTLLGTQVKAQTSVTLGQNVQWIESSTYRSNSTNSALIATKMANGTIQFAFSS